MDPVLKDLKRVCTVCTGIHYCKISIERLFIKAPGQKERCIGINMVCIVKIEDTSVIACKRLRCTCKWKVGKRAASAAE